MPRRARIVAPGVPHHITQRGTDRQTVFFTHADRQVYLGLLAEQSRLAELRILAYCLMRNHIHLVAVPEQEDSLALAMQRTHGRYAQYLNARRAAAWRDLIDCEEDEQQLRKLRRATYAGQPLGSEEFVASHGRPRAAAVRQLRTDSIALSSDYAQ